MTQITIIGAGLAGLSAGYHAKLNNLDYVLYEQDSRVGGLCKTNEKEGFFFDYSGHLLHLKDPYVQSLVQELLGNNSKIIQRNAFIYSNDVFTRYPFQANLYGLPPKVIKECLLEFIKANYENEDLPTKAYENFNEWILAKLGKGIGKHFMFPYNEKIWTVPTEQLTCEWLSEFVPKPSLEDVINGSFFDQKKEFGYNATFWYPKNGGIQALCDAFRDHVPKIKLNEKVVRVAPKSKHVEFASGKSIRYEKLISTISLKKLIEKVESDIPPEVKKAALRLRHNSILIINLGVGNGKLSNRHWVYIPEKKYAPYRVGIYSNFSRLMSPAGTSSYYIEIAYQKEWNINKEKVIDRAISEVIKMGFINKKENIRVQEIFDVETAYVIYDKYYSQSRKIVLDFLNKHDIYSIGRYGSWEYSGMEESMIQGKKIVDQLVFEI